MAAQTEKVSSELTMRSWTVTDCRWTNSDLDHWMAPKQGRRGGTFDSPGQEVSSRQP